MTITDITTIPNTKSRYRIYIDEKFAFVLYKGELSLYDVAVGNELSNEVYQNIITKVLPKRAKMRTLHLLKNRRYTEKQLREKLDKGEYPLDVINETIEYLKSYKYIDDNQYARDYIDYHLNQKSRNRLCQDLFNKGIPNELSRVIYTEIAGAEFEDIENGQIMKLLEKKKLNKDTADLKEKQRLFAFLFRKGFSAETIKKFLLT
ncbi:MAG: recombination regulator RecX [Lachnospiraceae bacterium]|nr:recombination regulator RecX [Lachnospiraceae bacterium]